MHAKGEKGKKSRERLLASAIHEFAHQGYHATKVSTIVARAGLTQAAFYLYFPSKEAIFAEIVNEFREQVYMLASAARIAPGHETDEIPMRIYTAIEAVFRFFATHPDLMRIAFVQAPNAEEIKAEMVALVAENLRAEQQAGYFRPEVSIEMVGEGLVGMIERFALRWLFPGEKDASTLAAQLADLLVHGILAPHA
jgi:TetR/AcrR family fatty acid metabolism transcriptional regulator